MALQDISIAVTSTTLELLQWQENDPYYKCKGWMTLNICHLLNIVQNKIYPHISTTFNLRWNELLQKCWSE